AAVSVGTSSRRPAPNLAVPRPTPAGADPSRQLVARPSPDPKPDATAGPAVTPCPSACPNTDGAQPRYQPPNVASPAVKALTWPETFHPGAPDRVSVTVTGRSSPAASHRSPAAASCATGSVTVRSSGSTLTTSAPCVSSMVAVMTCDRSGSPAS